MASDAEPKTQTFGLSYEEVVVFCEQARRSNSLSRCWLSELVRLTRHVVGPVLIGRKIVLSTFSDANTSFCGWQIAKPFWHNSVLLKAQNNKASDGLVSSSGFGKIRGVFERLLVSLRSLRTGLSRKQAGVSNKKRLNQGDIVQIREERRQLKLERPGGGGKRFVNADASGLNLSGLSWDGEDFSNCDLRTTNLSGATFNGSHFRDADLWGADLSDSDLTNALDLVPAQLGATDLTRTKLPESLKAFEILKSVDDLSQNSSKVFIAMLGGVVYTWLTTATTGDLQVFTNAGSVKLPVLGNDIPIGGFFVLAPITLLAFFIYFHIYLQRLWEALSGLPAIFPDRRRLETKTYPWLLNDLVRNHIPKLAKAKLPLSGLQTFISVLLGYWLIPITLAEVWAQSIRFSDWEVIVSQLLIFSVAIACACYFTRLLNLTFSSRAARPRSSDRLNRLIGVLHGIPCGLFVFIIGMFCSFLSVEYGINPFALLGIRTYVSLDHAELSTKPLSWSGKELDQVRGIVVTGRTLTIHAFDAFCVNAGFYNDVFRVSFFASCDFRRTFWKGVAAKEGDFVKCRFSENIRAQNRKDASLRRSDLNPAAFEGCILSGSRFTAAVLNDVRFFGCDLRRSDFSYADCNYAEFSLCSCKSCNFRAAELFRATFNLNDLEGVDFSGALLQETDLSRAIGLTEAQLRSAKTLYHAKLPKDLADKLSDELNRPPSPQPPEHETNEQ